MMEMNSRHINKKFISSLALRLSVIAIIMLSYISLTAGAAGPSSCAAPTGQPIQNEICNTWNGMLPIAVIAVLLSFTIAAIIFMVGTASKNERIRSFGVGELYEALATAIIVGSALLIAGLLVQTIPVTLLGLFSPGSSVPATTDPYVLSTSAILYTINTIQIEYDCVLYGNGGSSIGQAPPPPPPLGTGSQPSGPPCPYVSGSTPALINPVGGAVTGSTNFVFLSAYTTWAVQISAGSGYISSNIFTAIVQFALGNVLPIYRTFIYADLQLPETVVLAFLNDGLFVLWALYYLILFFSFVGPVFVTLGIIFRAFLPTRALGGILISTGIGFFVVAPVLFALLYSPSVNPYPTTLSYNACGGVNVFPSFICSTFGPIASVLSPLWLQAIFYPILITALTYTFVTQVANFVGASAQMGGRLRAGFI